MAEAKTDISTLIESLRLEREVLDGQLVEIERHRHLSVAEEAQVKRLKRLKLIKKDRMAAMQASLQRRA